jgi:hypothetical protein
MYDETAKRQFRQDYSVTLFVTSTNLKPGH